MDCIERKPKYMIRVSVITVCFNSDKTIRRTIESVLKQTYTNVEYIIIDGGSKDNTLQIIGEYKDLFGDSLKVVSEPDGGIYDAMNKGIRMAAGELIGILNSDDYYEENAVECIVNSMKNDKYQILYGFMRTVRDGEELSIARESHNMLPNEMIAHPACFVTKSIYDDFGVYDTNYVSVADFDFMIRMNMQREVVFVPVDYLITTFSCGGMSSTEKAWLDLLKLRKNYGMISNKKYKTEIFKSKVYSILTKKK